MRRTQVSLDEPLYEALRRRAFQRRVSMAHVVREALADYLDVDPETRAAAPEAGRAEASDQEATEP